MTTTNNSKSNAEQRMELFNDFSFKYIFRRESHKNVLISFLNDLLQGDKIISDIEYSNSELQADSPEGRNCLFDIVCTDQNKDKYLIEVQTTCQEYITTRMLHYGARLYIDGVEKGDQKYQRIKGVIGVCITLFNMQPPKFKTEYELIDNTDLNWKIENFKLIFLQIPRISDTFEKCSTLTEQWLYIMRNIQEVDNNITALRKEYAQLVELAKISALTEEERLSYYRAQHQVACLIDSYETARNKGLREGIEEGLQKGMERGMEKGMERGMQKGMQKGMEKGRKEEQLEIARVMKEKGFDSETISACTKLLIDEIQNLN